MQNQAELKRRCSSSFIQTALFKDHLSAASEKVFIFLFQCIHFSLVSLEVIASTSWTALTTKELSDLNKARFILTITIITQMNMGHTSMSVLKEAASSVI